MTRNTEEQIDKAKKLVNQEKFEEALEILENLYKNNPLSEHVKLNLINTLFSYGGYLNDEYTLQYNKAKQVFEKIIEIDPENYRAYYNLGIANFNLENLEQAKQCYEEAIKIKADYKHCLYNIGLVYEVEGNFQEALKYYEKALEIDPNFPYAFNARNQILANLDHLNKENQMLDKQEKVEKLKTLLDMSKRIKIEMIRTILEIDQDRLLTLLIDWGKNYKFEIDGDFLIINKKTVSNLIRSLKEMDI